jgi:hypothetical protein
MKYFVPLFLQANAEIALQLGYDALLSNPCQYYLYYDQCFPRIRIVNSTDLPSLQSLKIFHPFVNFPQVHVIIATLNYICPVKATSYQIL